MAAASSALIAGCSQNPDSKSTSNTTTDETTTSTETPKGTETSTPNQNTNQPNDPGTHKPMEPGAAGFEDLSFWQPHARVKLAADKQTVYQGSQSARIEKSSGTIVRRFPVPIDLSNKDISLAVKVDKLESPTNLRIWFTDSSGNQVRLIQQLNPNHPHTWIRINPSINSVNGNMSSIESMIITIDGDGQSKKYWVDDIRFKNKQAKKGQMMVSFDDIAESVYNIAFPIMKKHGIKGTVAVPPDIIGNRNRMNQSELMELKKAGWEIASHSNDLQGLRGLRRSAQKKKIERAKRLIKERGLGDAVGFMYPGGACDKNTIELVRENHGVGYLAFRPSQKGLSQSALMEPMFVNRSRPNTPNAMTNQMDVAVKYKGMYNMYLHTVGRESQINKEQFRQMCKSIANYRDQGKIQIVQPSDVAPKQ